MLKKIKMAVFLCVFLCLSIFTAYGGGSKENAKLVNTLAIPMTGLETVSIRYTADSITLLEAAGDEIILSL